VGLLPFSAHLTFAADSTTVFVFGTFRDCLRLSATVYVCVCGHLRLSATVCDCLRRFATVYDGFRSYAFRPNTSDGPWDSSESPIAV
jgi:hypothetical protein